MSNDLHLSTERWGITPHVVLSPLLTTSAGPFVSMRIKDGHGSEVVLFFRDFESVYMVEEACYEVRRRLAEGD